MIAVWIAVALVATEFALRYLARRMDANRAKRWEEQRRKLRNFYEGKPTP